jgi:hypothetical protein
MGTWDSARVRTLARSPHLSGLKMLEFWKATVTAGAVANLFLAPALKNLRDLCLVNDCKVVPADGEPPAPGAFDAALTRIVNSRRAARLERLWLDTDGVGRAAVRALLDSRRLGHRLAVLTLTAASARGFRGELKRHFGDVFYSVG